jgi:signal transduction histidine kinase
VVVELEDNGPGIEEEVLPLIFEPFFTTKSRTAGTGLGLAVARSIVEEIGGSIEAENRGGGPDKGGRAPSGVAGARFRVKLSSSTQREGIDG